MQKATLSIDIWTDGRRKLPDDLSEALAPHLEHVAKGCEQGYVAGEIVDDRFRGWWKMERDG